MMKKVRQPVTVEFQEEHLSVIIKALEVLSEDEAWSD